MVLRAIVQDEFGTAEVLELREIDRPTAGVAEVFVRVVAASAHIGDWHYMTGLPYLFRISGAGLRNPRTRVRGTNFAGRIESVGQGVSEFRSGDEVFGICAGAFADYATPRHRHNFDQIRCGLSGAMNYAPRKDVVAAAVAYFPEGTFYGPQRMAGESLVLLLQLGGASGQGFMCYEELQAGHAALAARGTFADGIYRGADGRPRDGYEAVWEHVHGRPISYPPPRFEEPILMWPAHGPWMASRNEPGPVSPVVVTT